MKEQVMHVATTFEEHMAPDVIWFEDPRFAEAYEELMRAVGHRLAEICECRPVEDSALPDYWIHNAFDERESYFEHGRKLH